MPYTPKPPPRTSPEFQEFYDYVEQELQSIARELGETTGLELRTTSQIPSKPREGMIVRADGTSWDPGGGAGNYRYTAGAWVKMGDAVHTHSLAEITDDGALAALNSVALSNMATMATDRILGRDTVGVGIPEVLTLSQVLDFIGSPARGDILIRGVAAWARLGIGASGRVLSSNGTDPSWTAPTSDWSVFGDLTPPGGSANLDIINIPQTHKVLVVQGIQLDTSANASVRISYGATSTFATLRNARAAYIEYSAGGFFASGQGASITNPVFGYADIASGTYFTLIFFDYSNTSKFKFGFLYSNSAFGPSQFLGTHVVESTAGISNIRLAASAGVWNASGKVTTYGLLV